MRSVILVTCALASALAGSAQNLPHLEKRGKATQLMVDGKPFLMLAGELTNTAASDTESMRPIWSMLAQRAHLNTALVGIAWDWVEPEEGRFDFQFVDAAIGQARQNNMRIVLLWFASWKNGLSSFVPAWVKTDQQRFPRAQVRAGKSVEVLSLFHPNNVKADAKAFAALMRHLRETDTTRRVIMIQVENEVGLLGDARDRSPAANQAFAMAVPKEFTDWLAKRRQELLPEFRQVWEGAGAKTSGTWAQVFGGGGAAEEIFMAWHYARYLNALADAGKREYELPMFVNAWIVQPEDKGPGDYPSGGPQAHMHDVWRAGAPRIDLLCPDIYLPDFTGLTAKYTRAGNALFVPESFSDARGAANAFYAIGAHSALGYSPFAIDRMADQTAPETSPLSHAYAMLSQLAPEILEHQSKGTIAGIALDKGHPEQELSLGGYSLSVSLIANSRAPNAIPDVTGYAIVMSTGPDEFLMAGDNLQISFTPETPGPPIASVARQAAGRFENGKWITTRLLGGDDSVLHYNFAKLADAGQSGSGVRLRAPGEGIQKVKLYRYQ